MGASNKLALAIAGLAIAGLALAAPAAEAADLGRARRAGPPAYEAPFEPELGRPVVAFDHWMGFYVGGTIGYGFGTFDAGGGIGTFPISVEGGLGTVHAGYNWQLGRLVLGLETDLGFGGVGGSAPGSLGSVSADLNAFGSFRGRAGYALSPALLVYGTLGLAWANYDFSLAGGPLTSETLFGLQAGIGAELAVSRHLSLRLEYMYTDLESERVILQGVTSTFDPDSHAVRAGLSLRF